MFTCWSETASIRRSGRRPSPGSFPPVTLAGTPGALLWLRAEPPHMVDLLAHLLEFLLGPLFLLLHLPELGVAGGDLLELALLLLAGDVGLLLEGLLAGEFGVGTRTLASGAGGLLWLVALAAVLGDVGELGVLELFELLE